MIKMIVNSTDAAAKEGRRRKWDEREKKEKSELAEQQGLAARTFTSSKTK